ncbi:MAG TPA: hypothetical protein VNC39_17300 [Acidocella sp.]|jgi:hypothetical protein|uniref:hypothetical protein n=1 Tax=Acidocella sp. TaxID=50710 RepID=UPI002BB4A8D0|nr:hypothetical protein [Acidocella sp.]HVE23728.1 hypothetical protein [Acidocella sp.]
MNTPPYPRSLVLCGTAAFCVLGLFGSAFAAPPQILVGPFDMFDTSADQRPFVITAQQQWVEAAEQVFAEKLNASARLCRRENRTGRHRRRLRPAASAGGSSRFLKKAAQKLLLCWAMGCVGDNAHGPA